LNVLYLNLKCLFWVKVNLHWSHLWLWLWSHSGPAPVGGTITFSGVGGGNCLVSTLFEKLSENLRERLVIPTDLRTVSTGFSILVGYGEKVFLLGFRAEFVILAPDDFDGDRSGDSGEIIVRRKRVISRDIIVVIERLKFVNVVVL